MSYSASIIEKGSISGWQPGGDRSAAFLEDFISALEQQKCTAKRVTKRMYGANVLSYKKSDGTRGYLYHQGGNSLWWGFSRNTICRMLELAANGEPCFCVAQGYLSSERDPHFWWWEATQEDVKSDWTRILVQEMNSKSGGPIVTLVNADASQAPPTFTRCGDLAALVQLL